jgi:hypothetical protein
MSFGILTTNEMWMVSKNPHWIFEFQVCFNICINLCKYSFFINSNFVVIVEQKIWNNDNKQTIYLDMQYLHMGISYCIL